MSCRAAHRSVASSTATRCPDTGSSQVSPSCNRQHGSRVRLKSLPSIRPTGSRARRHPVVEHPMRAAQTLARARLGQWWWGLRGDLILGGSGHAAAGRSLQVPSRWVPRIGATARGLPVPSGGRRAHTDARLHPIRSRDEGSCARGGAGTAGMASGRNLASSRGARTPPDPAKEAGKHGSAVMSCSGAPPATAKPPGMILVSLSSH